MNNYFAYDPEGDGYEEFKTENEAKEYAEKSMREYYGEGSRSIKEVSQVVYGKITHRATEYNVVKRPPDSQIDYEGVDLGGVYWESDWDFKCDYKMIKVENL